jgi:hypothetical protein
LTELCHNVSWANEAVLNQNAPPCIVQTRLHWLAYRRWHAAIRGNRIAGRDLEQPVSRTKDPIVVQLVGRQDSFASPLDQVDIAVDGHDPSSPPHDRRYFYVETPNTDHDHTTVFAGTADGKVRRDLFVDALTQPPRGLDAIASDPSLLADEIPQTDPSVTDAVFIMHGIRDDGFWTHHIAKVVREHAASSAPPARARLRPRCKRGILPKSNDGPKKSGLGHGGIILGISDKNFAPQRSSGRLQAVQGGARMGSDRSDRHRDPERSEI